MEMEGAATSRTGYGGARSAAPGVTPPPQAGVPSGSAGGGSGARADAGSPGAFRWVRDPLRRQAWPSWTARPVGPARGPWGWAKAAAGLVLDRWHRSLQLRVIGTTLAVSALVVAVLGFFLMQQIASGLIANAEKQANSQLVDGMQQALSQPGVAAPPTRWDQAETVMGNVSSELRSGSGPSSDYSVVVLVAQNRVPKIQLYGLGWTEGQTLDSISAALRDDVTDAQDRGDNTQTYQQPTRLAYAGGSVPALAVGIPLGNYYQLYYVFPQTKILATLQLVQRTLLVGGLALVVLLALIASLVTRWVVVPVRRAAEAAQRVSAGDLNERMEVQGSDDLAALATSFNEMAASLQDKLSELEGLSQVQRQFVSDVSHELRTPLTTIRIAADVLHAARDELDRSAARSAELLQGQLERFESLLADLLEISRYDANAATLDAEPVDVCDLVRRSADVAQQLAEQRGARIEFRLPAHPCVAEADRRRVERILRNLLVNAVEHGEGRETVVTVAADRDAVAVAVRDHGVGLKPGEEQLVFDRFWRADPARARTSGGTGLGLSIAQEDARLHGGWLEAWGECGRGSVFRLTLPRVAGAKLEGSPLPLRPDEAELATGLHVFAAGLPVTLVGIAGLDPADGAHDDGA
jgi:two-component system sensor histidine kinase MtrB